jgi:hypothetical protein
MRGDLAAETALAAISPILAVLRVRVARRRGPRTAPLRERQPLQLDGNAKVRVTAVLRLLMPAVVGEEEVMHGPVLLLQASRVGSTGSSGLTKP